MNFSGKRFLAFLLAMVLVLGLMPVGAQPVEAVEPDMPSKADYANVDAVFAAINNNENQPAKKNATRQQKLADAKAIVLASDNYVDGSLKENGNAFTWMTEEGIRCGYNPRMRDIQAKQNREASEDLVVNVPQATKGGSPSSKQVYLIGPYYGSDENFTNQYKNEARRVAKAIGDTDGYTLYSGSSATIEKVAEAVSNGAVVFFDSHGTTDYENPNDEYDFITGATCSYLCLSSNYGLTTEDYNDGAIYDGVDAYVNGAAIANHMTKNSPNGILWMAICLGMGTDTLYAPLRAKGVEVVYGYSESVTFIGDYLYEETFWGEMITGATVAQSIATMKSKWGNWDYSVQIASHYGENDGYATIAEARKDFCAFPVVVSSEDAYPGQRTAEYNETNGFYGADSLQTVKSTYKFAEVFEVTDPTEPGDILAEAYALAPGEELPYEATLTGVITNVTTAYNDYYGNVTVIMEVPGYADMPIKCYRLTGNGADKIGVGDTITVKGTIVNYQHSSGDTEVEFTQGCQLVSWVSGGAAPTDPTEPDATEPTEPAEPTGEAYLYFTDKANRVSWDGTQQLWQQNGITLLNEKAGSSTAVADYANPARFYKSSKITVTASNMVKLDFNCNNATYASALASSIPTDGGVQVAINGSVVTVTLPAAANSFVINSLTGGQVRMDSVKVYFAAAETPTEPTEPSTEPTEPSTEPTEPSTEPTEPSAPLEPAYSGQLDFSTADNRVSQTAAQQLWEQNGITLLNEKGSGSNVADFVNPARFYSGSKITVTSEDMLKLEFTCSTSAYANTLASSIPSGETQVSVSGKVVTVTFPGITNSFVILSLSGQVRVNTLTVYYAAYTEPTEPTEPSTEPTEPSTEPTEPSVEPTEPSVEPTEPSTEPTEPSVEPTEPAESGEYVQITAADELVSGQYVMVVSSGYAPLAYDSGWVLPAQPAVSGNKVTDAQGAVWTVTVSAEGVTLQDANGKYIAPKGGNSNGIINAEYVWAVTFANGTFRFAGTDGDTVLLASNTTPTSGENRFRGYKTTTVTGSADTYLCDFTLYKLVEEDIVDPSEPTEPSEPSEPSEPTEPSEPSEPSEPTVMLGDLDGDGAISFQDLGALQAHLSGKSLVENQAAADLDGDGAVSFLDLGALQAHLSGKSLIGQ